MTMKDEYRGRFIESAPVCRADGRWSVAVRIDGRYYAANDHIGYILKVEAEKECLNLGRRLIDLGRA